MREPRHRSASDDSYSEDGDAAETDVDPRTFPQQAQQWHRQDREVSIPTSMGGHTMIVTWYISC